MIQFSRFAQVAIALLVLSSTLVAPVFAQSAPEPGNETVGPVEPDDGNSNNSSSDEGGGFGNWVSNATPSINNPVPSASDMVSGLFEWVQDKAVGVMEGILEGSIEVVIGTPQPGNSGWIGVFGEPTNEPFATLYEPLYEEKILPFTLIFLVGAILIIGGFMPYSSLVGSYRIHMWLIRLVVAIFALTLAWPLSALMHQIASDIAYMFAPETEEILSITGALSLGSSAAPVAATIYFVGWFKVAVYAFIYFFRYQLLIWMPFVFPILLVMSLAAPHKRLRSFGSFAIWQYVGLLIMPIPNAIMFGGAYLLEWGFGVNSFANVGLVFGMFLIGILLPIGILYAFAQGPGLVTGVMMGTASSAASGIRNRSENGWKPDSAGRARDLSQRVRTHASSTYGSVRSRLESSGGSSKTATDGGVTSSGSGSSSSAGSSSSSEIKSKYGDDSESTTLADRLSKRGRNNE